jgi:membrane protease YdiL (CAAX protease family)
MTVRGPCYWDYTDVCAFLICVVMLGTLLRLAIIFHVLSAVTIQQPSVLVQAGVSLCVLLTLYATLKVRHRRAVWRALGWTLPSYAYVLAASLAGVLLAGTVTLIVRSSNIPAPLLAGWKIAALAATLGPILEESFFRGCLLPLIGRTLGSPAAVILTALLFAFFHQPLTVLHCACFASQWYCLWVDARCLKIHHGAGAHPRRPQPDPLRVPKLVMPVSPGGAEGCPPRTPWRRVFELREDVQCPSRISTSKQIRM